MNVIARVLIRYVKPYWPNLTHSLGYTLHSVLALIILSMFDLASSIILK